nr:PREDICTED: uncharacterized protein LOC109043730 [Bemisia tabaci]
MAVKRCCVIILLVVLLMAIQYSESQTPREILNKYLQSDPCRGGRGSSCLEPPEFSFQECDEAFSSIITLAQAGAGNVHGHCKSAKYSACRKTVGCLYVYHKCTAEVTFSTGTKKLVALKDCMKSIRGQ